MERNIPFADAWKLAEDGQATIVDVRGPVEFGLGHPPRALSLPYSARGLEGRLNILLDTGRAIIVLANGSVQIEGSVAQLADSSFDLLGVLDSSGINLDETGIPIEKVKEITISEILNEQYRVLDVREQIEWEMGYIPNSYLLSLGNLRENIHAIPKDLPIAVICEAGIRSSSAVSLLKASGFENVVDVP